jgi:hypothetical protein
LSQSFNHCFAFLNLILTPGLYRSLPIASFTSWRAIPNWSYPVYAFPCYFKHQFLTLMNFTLFFQLMEGKATYLISDFVLFILGLFCLICLFLELSYCACPHSFKYFLLSLFYANVDKMSAFFLYRGHLKTGFTQILREF